MRACPSFRSKTAPSARRYGTCPLLPSTLVGCYVPRPGRTPRKRAMNVVKIHQLPSLRPRVSDSEWQARLDLAAAYRLTAHYGWTHLINNHISLRVPGTEDQFLINPYGFLYEQITASS